MASAGQWKWWIVSDSKNVLVAQEAEVVQPLWIHHHVLLSYWFLQKPFVGFADDGEQKLVAVRWQSPFHCFGWLHSSVERGLWKIWIYELPIETDTYATNWLRNQPYLLLRPLAMSGWRDKKKYTWWGLKFSRKTYSRTLTYFDSVSPFWWGNHCGSMTLCSNRWG